MSIVLETSNISLLEDKFENKISDFLNNFTSVVETTKDIIKLIYEIIASSAFALGNISRTMRFDNRTLEKTVINNFGSFNLDDEKLISKREVVQGLKVMPLLPTDLGCWTSPKYWFLMA